MNIRFTGDEHFTFEQMPVGALLSDFWSWTTERMLTDDVLPILAHYIVETALGDKIDRRRITIVVSSYLKSFSRQDKIEAPVFHCPDADDTLRIFCLLDGLNANTVNPLKLEQWKFFVLKSGDLTVETATLDEIRHIATEASYEELRNTVTARL